MFWRFGGYANVSTLDTILDKPDLTVEELLEESDLIQELKQNNSKLVEYLRDENVLDRLLRYVLAPGPPTASHDDNDEEAIEGAGNKTRSRAGSDAAASKTGVSGGTGTSPGSPLGTSSSNTGIDNFFSKRRKSRSKSFSKPDYLEESAEEAQRKKYAFVACEILSSEVYTISEALVENPSSLRDFWAFLKRPPPLDPVQAGYFNKVNEALLDRKTEEMLEFIKSIDNVVPDLVVHVDCPPIMDLLLKMISLDKVDGGQGIVDWLQSQNLIPILLSYLSSEHSSATQTSAGDFLKAIITISANATTQDQSVIGPNELTRQLVSEQCIKKLISDMLRGGSPLTVGVGIIIEVIRKNNSDYDLESQIGPTPRTTDPIYLGTLLRQFAKNVSNFMTLILSSDRTDPNDPTSVKKRREIRVAFGETIEPLGFDRFKTCELMAELLHCSNMALLNERGSEAEVRQRDEERERLKAEGKLTATAADDEDEDAVAIRRAATDENELGTSVDSAGFHHARAPSSNLSDSPDEIRRLEVQNTTDEEEFEKVNAPLPEISSETTKMDETKGDGNERKNDEESKGSGIIAAVNEGGSSTSKRSSSGKTAEQSLISSEEGITEMVDRLSLEANNDQQSGATVKANDNSLSPDIPAISNNQDHSSSTSPNARVSLLTQKIRGSADFAEGDETGLSPSQRGGEEGGADSDRPAPLFQSKESRPRAGTSGSVGGDNSGSATGSTESSGQKPPPYTIEVGPSERSVAEGDGAANFGERPQSVLFAAAHESEFGPAYEVDVDGSPVVGDFLKMMFVEYRVVPTILDFFFRFPWNNFLHNVVYDVVQQVFNGQMERGFNRSLAIDLFETGRITERIIEGQAKSDIAQAETNMRLGYMGHLTLIAEEVVKFTERHPPELLSQSVVDKVLSHEWNDYVENTLAETRERDNAILGGVRPDMAGGPRQAVLSAVGGGNGSGDDGDEEDGSGIGGSGFMGVSAGTSGNVDISAADLIENGAGIGVESMDLSDTTGVGTTTSTTAAEMGGDGAGAGGGAGYALAGGAGTAAMGAGSLLSGFTNSSDEEDDELDELEGEGRSGPLSGAAAAAAAEGERDILQPDESDQTTNTANETRSSSSPLSTSSSTSKNFGNTASNANATPSPLSLSKSNQQQSQQSQRQSSASTSPSPSSPSSSAPSSSSSPSKIDPSSSATTMSITDAITTSSSGHDSSGISANDSGTSSSSSSSSSSIPPPLNIPPSRARRQFAARLAQRKKEAAEAEAAGAAGSKSGSESRSEDRRASGSGSGIRSGSGSASTKRETSTAAGTIGSVGSAGSVGDRIRAIEAGKTGSSGSASGAGGANVGGATNTKLTPRPRPKLGRKSGYAESFDGRMSIGGVGIGGSAVVGTALSGVSGSGSGPAARDMSGSLASTTGTGTGTAADADATNAPVANATSTTTSRSPLLDPHASDTQRIVMSPGPIEDRNDRNESDGGSDASDKNEDDRDRDDVRSDDNGDDNASDASDTSGDDGSDIDESVDASDDGDKSNPENKADSANMSVGKGKGVASTTAPAPASAATTKEKFGVGSSAGAGAGGGTDRLGSELLVEREEEEEEEEENAGHTDAKMPKTTGSAAAATTTTTTKTKKQHQKKKTTGKK